MQTAFDSDLVRDSKLKTTLNGDITCHIIETAGRNARQRKIQKEQLWKIAENLGQGTFSSVWLERLVGGESVVNERAVKVIKKQVQKPGAIDYSRELETIAKFSHPRVNHSKPLRISFIRCHNYLSHHASNDANSTISVLSSHLAGLKVKAMYSHGVLSSR
jgi:hypothetical protein